MSQSQAKPLKALTSLERIMQNRGMEKSNRNQLAQQNSN